MFFILLVWFGDSSMYIFENLQIDTQIDTEINN